MLDGISNNIYPEEPIEVNKDSSLEKVFKEFWENTVRNGYLDLIQYNDVLKKIKNKYRKISLFPIVTPDVTITNVIQIEVIGKQINEVQNILENSNIFFEVIESNNEAIFKIDSIKI